VEGERITQKEWRIPETKEGDFLSAAFTAQPTFPSQPSPASLRYMLDCSSSGPILLLCSRLRDKKGFAEVVVFMDFDMSDVIASYQYQDGQTALRPEQSEVKMGWWGIFCFCF